MPTISMFFGILIKMYFKEHNPPHFHAYYQGFSAVFEIKSGKLVSGFLPKKAEKIISEWTQENTEKLLENWELMEQEKPLFKIPGADQ